MGNIDAEGSGNMFEEGPLRRWLRRRRGFSPYVLVGGEWVDAEIDRLIEEKKKEWRARGYSESLIRMATDLAKGWVSKMSEAFAPPELKSAVARHIAPKAVMVADQWITKIGEAAKASMEIYGL
jgi:hypothetical protein